jgi:hypothetical protein
MEAAIQRAQPSKRVANMRVLKDRGKSIKHTSCAEIRLPLSRFSTKKKGRRVHLSVNGKKTEGSLIGEGMKEKPTIKSWY